MDEWLTAESSKWREPALLPRDLDHILAGAVTEAEIGKLVVSETRQHLIWLSCARLAFLRRATASGSRPVLVSHDGSELTEAMRQALRFHNGGWAIREADGRLRNGLTGRRLAAVNQALNNSPVEDPDDLSLRHLGPTDATHVHLLVNVTVWHPRGPVPLPAEAIEVVLSGLTGTAPFAFGRAEPALHSWDAAEIGWLCDQDNNRGLRRSSFVVAGPPEAPAALVLRVEHYAEATAEHISGVISFGRLTDPGLPERLAMVDPTMTELSSICDTRFALMTARAARFGLTTPSQTPSAEFPLSIILGSGLVDGLAINTHEIVRRFRAMHNQNGLVVPLDAGGDGGARLTDLLGAVGFFRATPRMGVSPRQLQAVRHAARY